jgi:hypothetical protein
MKINVTNLLLGILILVMSYKVFFPEPAPEPAPITVTIPEKVGTTGKQTIQDVRVVPIYLPNQEKPVTVDADLKDKYEKAKDSLDQLNLYLDAIRIRDYNKTFVDNDTIKISGTGRVRGQLLDYQLDWKIKESAFTYKPKVVTQFPKFSIKGELEFGLPNLLQPVGVNSPDLIAKANLRFLNRKGNSLSIGVDTEKRIWIGGGFTIFKTR